MVSVGTVLVALISAGSADAHKISKERVHQVSTRLVQDLCNRDRTCTSVEVEPCHREAKHIARCNVHYFGEDRRSPYKCRWVFEWSINEGSNRLHLSRRVFENTFKCRRQSGAQSLRPSQSGEAPGVDGDLGPAIRTLGVG